MSNNDRNDNYSSNAERDLHQLHARIQERQAQRKANSFNWFEAAGAAALGGMAAKFLFGRRGS